MTSKKYILLAWSLYPLVSLTCLAETVAPETFAKEVLEKKLPGALNAKAYVSEDIKTLKEANKAAVEALNLTPAELNATTAPWDMFAAELRKQIAGGDKLQGLQIVNSPIAACWDDQVLGNWRAWRVLSDTIPMWASGYVPTKMQVTTGYQIFIENIAIPQPNKKDQKEADAAQAAYNKQNRLLQKLWGAVGQHWADFNERQALLPANRRLSFDQWFAKFDGVEIGQEEKKAAGLAQKYQHFINLAYGGYGFASSLVLDFNNPAFQLPAQSGDGLNLSYRTFSITPDLAEWVKGSKAISNSGKPKIEIKFDKDTHHSHFESERWSGGVSIGFGFFSFGANASHGRQSLDVSDSKFSFLFSAANFETFTITPGKWFNGTAVKAFKNGPWIDGPIKDGSIKLWGPQGVFNLTPQQILVAFKPKVVICMSESNYNSVQTSFKAGGGFSIGCFGFGAAYGKNTSDVKWDDATHTITAEDSSDVPQIIAVISNVLPENQ